MIGLEIQGYSSLRSVVTWRPRQEDSAGRGADEIKVSVTLHNILISSLILYFQYILSMFYYIKYITSAS